MFSMVNEISIYKTTIKTLPNLLLTISSRCTCNRWTCNKRACGCVLKVFFGKANIKHLKFQATFAHGSVSHHSLVTPSGTMMCLYVHNFFRAYTNLSHDIDSLEIVFIIIVSFVYSVRCCLSNFHGIEINELRQFSDTALEKEGRSPFVVDQRITATQFLSWNFFCCWHFQRRQTKQMLQLKLSVKCIKYRWSTARHEQNTLVSHCARILIKSIWSIVKFGRHQRYRLPFCSCTRVAHTIAGDWLELISIHLIQYLFAI